jgi:hypothetical protein
MKKLLLLVWVLGGVVTAAVGAAGDLATIVAEPDFTVGSAVDWAAATVTMEITHKLDPTRASLVRAKEDAETDIDGRLPDFLSRAVAPLMVDSSHTLGDLLGADPGLFAKFNALDLGARRDQLFLSPDFSSLVARYSLPLFGERGVASPLYPSRATPLKRRLGWVATRKFSGLLIYAQGPLPEVGSSRTSQARPALFPRLWDEQMSLVLDKDMCAPEALAKWGMVGYALAPDEDAAVLRAGNVPLRLAARGVFGDKATDIVIPTEGALQLLTVPENLTLLREGRIVIVYDKLR